MMKKLGVALVGLLSLVGTVGATAGVAEAQVVVVRRPAPRVVVVQRPPPVVVVRRPPPVVVVRRPPPRVVVVH